MKRFIRNSLLLILPFSLAMMSASAVYAKETAGKETENRLESTVDAAELIASGTCGENASFTLDKDGLLKITGSGEVNQQGWQDYSEQVRKLEVSGPSVLGTYLFSDCDNLKEAVLGDSVTEIGRSCFYQDPGDMNASLESIRFGKGIRKIGVYAFYGNNKLKKVYIDDLAVWCQVDIGKEPYSSETGYDSSPLMYGAELIHNGKTIKDLVIPSSVERIGTMSFYHYIYLESLVIPATVKRVGSYAFASTPHLSSVKFEGSAPEPEFSIAYDYSYSGNIFGGYDMGDPGVTWDETIPELKIEHPIGDPSYTNRIRFLYSSSYSASDAEGEDPNEDWPDIFTYSKYDMKAYTSDRIRWPEPDPDLIAHGGCGENMTWALDKKGVLTISGSGQMDEENYVFSWQDHTQEVKKVIIGEGVESTDYLAFDRCTYLRSITIPVSVMDIAEYTADALSYLKYVCYAGSEEEWSKINIQDNNRSLLKARFYFNGELPDDLDEEVKITSIKLNIEEAEMPTSRSAQEPSTLKLKAIVEPANADSDYIYWFSTNPQVATVDDHGVVTALTYGHAEIRAVHKSGTGSAYCVINTRYYDVAGSPDKGDPDYQYFFNPVYWAADNNITKGYGNVYFGPDENCTREQMITFLYRTAGSPKVSGTVSFSDVQKGSYYYNAVLWASQKGITNGYSSGPYKGKFGVGLNVTREDTMTFIYRMAGKPKYSTSKTFKDIAKGKYYYDAVRWAAQNGITNGYSDGTFGVGKDVLRRDIVTFLYRYAE